MRAIVQNVYGEADVLRLAHIERPGVSAPQVLIRVRAAGVDPGVWHLMTGQPRLTRLFFGLRRPRSRIRGLDVAGVVEAVGKDVTIFKVGDEVFGIADGAFAEFACARQDRLALKPAGLSFEQSAALPVPGCTALQALRDSGKLQRGQRVLIVGASGGVGSFAVQLARYFGAHVTGVCRSSKLDFVRSLGAHEVTDYTRSDFTVSEHCYDLILDIGGNRPLATLRRLLTPSGRLVLVGAEGGGKWFGSLGRSLRALLPRPLSQQTLRVLASSVRAADLQILKTLAEAGTLTPEIDRCYPLEGVPEAIRTLSAGEVRGKVVISVAGE